MESRFSFTKEKLQALPSPEAGQRLTVHDTKATGLQLRVTSAGAKTFSLYRRIKGGQPERITLGRFPAMTVEQARKAAAQLNAEIEGGASPAALKRSIKAELSFENALTEFLAGKRKRDGSPISDKTKKDYRDLLRLHLDCIKGKKLSAVERTEVKAIHAKVSKKSPAQADKCVALVSAVYVYMLDMEFFTGPNPAERVKKNQSVQRDRFLQSDELPAFFKALAAMPNESMRDLFMLALLTGARRSNVCAMAWSDIDLEAGVWRIAKTKNGTPQNVTLSPEAVQVLKARKEGAEASSFVFPSTGKTGHIVEPKGAWAKLLESAGIGNLRIHDLRRTLGSWQARSGASLPIIGKSLNHKTHQATAIYARLDLDPVRQSVNTATAAMMEAAGLKKPAEVVTLPVKAA
ncbi:MAG: tyrosine-type recombinase/integrase [Curvibacter lanceolatus]|uniref:tyrosine-type recombinase/integrase n=1 Tax=Curvibacter lanceolatus TaxID=86182 RepID=UPI002353DD4D|nr:site-specific integrase [Curvibacter lanceolatus]MBV5295399.1 tyrosine-type recombinase/integrase [Curvibacter lanceolatus]